MTDDIIIEQNDKDFDTTEFENDDTPIQSNNTPELLKALMSNASVPKQVLKNNWELFTNDITLSFQTEQTKRLKMMDFDLLKIDSLMSEPYYEYTFEKENLWNKLRMQFEMKLDRATGFKVGGRMNERLVQQTQFGEQKMTKNIESSGSASGLFASMLGKRR